VLLDEEEVRVDDEWDLVVIGSGAGGLAAAVSAAEGGSRVLVFESEREFGGSMALSGGVFCAAGTSVQKAMGLEDSPESYYQHYMDLNQWVLRPSLIRTFCRESTPTFEWLLSLGLEVPPHFSENSHQPGIRKLGVGTRVAATSRWGRATRWRRCSTARARTAASS
jgi:succinate dehydrogenase/fumarate reductase flavoprotein subunit